MTKKIKVSLCTTLKNRTKVKYTASDINEQEGQWFTRIENTLAIVEKENSNNENFIRVKGKFKNFFTYSTDCVDSLDEIISNSNLLDHFEFEVIITDWCSTDCDVKATFNKEYKSFKVKVISVEENQFSRGRGLNIAAQNSNADILYFFDVDLLYYNIYMLKECLEKAASGVSVWPVFYKASDPVFYNLFPEWASYGTCFMTKAQYEKYGPWPEYLKWGKEDTDLYMRFLGSGEKIFRKAYLGYIHQWHSEKSRHSGYIQ